MAQTTRKGMTPFRKRGGAPFTAGRERFLVSNGYGTALAAGDPVYVSAGLIRIAANTSAGEDIFTNPGRDYGVFEGCAYIDPTTKQPVESTYFAAGTSSGGQIEGESQVIGYVTLSRDTTFLMIADASVSALAAGSLFSVSVGTPDSIIKRSSARLKEAVASAGVDHMVRVVSFPNITGSAADDANTVVEVEFALPTNG